MSIASTSKIFISRKLKKSSPFFHRLKEKGYIIHGVSLIHFSAVQFSDFPKTDWIFFYSKNAVRFFFGQLQQSPLCKYACIGLGTATFLKQYGILADFIGDGKNESTSQRFLTVANKQKVLFPRAKNSQQSVQKLLGNKINAIDLIVYDNQPKMNFMVPESDILVFTSPMNAQIYYDRYNYQKNQKVIAIGNTTKKALKKLGIKNIMTSSNPTEDALVDLILSKC